MISPRRILLGLFLGTLLAAGLTLTFAQVDPGAKAITPRSILRSDMPPMDPEPTNTVTPLYSPEWWRAQAAIEKFREKYLEAILIITPASIDRPVYVFGGEGSGTSMIVTPMYRLPIYAEAIRRGYVVWCPLRDAFGVLAACDGPGLPDNGDAEALRAARATIAEAIKVLSRP